MKKLIETKNLEVYYPIQNDFSFKDNSQKVMKALHKIDIDINKGEILGLVGESGCGKSTLGKAILKLVQSQGDIFYEEENINNFNNCQLKNFRKKAQLIFQNPYSSLNPKMTIFQILKEPLIIHNVKNKHEIENRIIEIADLVGLNKDFLNRYPHEFSGGQRQRIAIARALILKPNFLVADEPVSALDVSIQAQIITLLKELKEKLDLTILFISHDLGVVKYLSDRIAVMYLGEIIEIAEAKELFNHPMHPYTKALISSVPSIHKKQSQQIKLDGDLPSPLNPPNGCKFHTRCPQKIKMCSIYKPTETMTIDNHIVKCHLYNE